MSDPNAPIGEGATHMAVGDRDGKVVLTFHRPVQWMELEPSTAVEVAKELIEAAVNNGARVSINAPRPKVPNALRERMTRRTLHILMNKRNARETDAILSVRLVDTLLNMLDL